MSRLVVGSLIVALTAFTTLGGGCRKDPDLQPMHPQPGDLPPLPPASGTSVGYLLDASATLALRQDQVQRLKEIDTSLAAQNDVIDTQLREIEKPEAEEPAEKGAPPPRRNNAPCASTVTTPDAQKLHATRKANDRAALTKVFAVLDPKQQEDARRILTERGVESPGAGKAPPPDHTEDGEPLPGGEP
ncbi:MAG: hypothetical protein NT062_07565 [Proteobacteria bacterium]|nr:hypothetical protein [Pseudomonadota bacterium]